MLAIIPITVDGQLLRNKAITLFFFLMIRRPPRSTRVRSSAASDVYKRQKLPRASAPNTSPSDIHRFSARMTPVSYTHLRAHETPEHLVCRLLLEKKKN